MKVLSAREAQLLEALKDVEDPELSIDIVNLGLIVDLHKVGECVEMHITFTAMGCPAMEMIIDDVRSRLLRESGVSVVNIEIVWEPIWSKDRLSADGRLALLSLGMSL